ncbi:MAG: glycosyltransferase family 2 protein [Flavobacteriales bacterium]
MVQGTVTIITPVYNGLAYVEAAWQSLLAQTHTQWEWLVVDNASTDAGMERLRTLVCGDPRVRFLYEPLKGSGNARNAALPHIKGEVVAFLDIDDRLPAHSLSSRYAQLQAHPEWQVVDGTVRVMDADLQETKRTWTPDFTGPVWPELLQLSDACFFGITWMFRREVLEDVRFSDTMTHCEDLLFCLSVGQVNYGYTPDAVLDYRTGQGSLMRDLDGLEAGYRKVVRWVTTHPDTTSEQRAFFRGKVRSVMVKSWLKRGNIWSALRCAMRSW